jgi:hypothetical protein
MPASNSRTRAASFALRGAFRLGGAYQFDWSHEVVLLGGVTVTVKVAAMKRTFASIEHAGIVRCLMAGATSSH